MEVILEGGNGQVREAFARAVGREALLPAEPGARGLWWRAGLLEALARHPQLELDRVAAPVYETAPSPRSTRGATRA